MPTIEVAPGYSRNIYFRIVRTHIKKANEKTIFMCFVEKFQFFGRGEHCFKHKVLPFFQAFVAYGRCFPCSPQNGIWGIPISKLLLRYIIRVYIHTVTRPLICKQSFGCRSLARTIWTSDYAKNRATGIFCFHLSKNCISLGILYMHAGS